MTVLPILEYPDRRLLTIAAPVQTIDDSTRRLVSDMAETMYHPSHPGVGLAATQVDAHVRVVVVDVSESRDHLQVFINPELVGKSSEMSSFSEGCLSVPGFYGEVVRPSQVMVRSLDLDGEVQLRMAEGLLAVCIQHEIDHLNGRVFLDLLPENAREEIECRIKSRTEFAKKLLTFQASGRLSPSGLVDSMDDNTSGLIEELIGAMHTFKLPELGLAAGQFGQLWQIFVMGDSEDRDKPMVFVNPKILRKSPDRSQQEETCPSFPGEKASVDRAKWVVVRALGRDGRLFTVRAEGLLARGIQHQMDHLLGRPCLSGHQK